MLRGQDGANTEMQLFPQKIFDLAAENKGLLRVKCVCLHLWPTLALAGASPVLGWALLSPTFYLLTMELYLLFYYLFMRHTQKETETQAEGEAGSMQGAQCGTRSQDPGIMA